MTYSHSETYEKTEKNYLRPFVNLGNLNGQEGNAFMVMGNVSSALKKCGYIHESSEITELFMKTNPCSYEDGLDKMSYFVDYTNDTTLVDEDDEFLYLKIRKNEGHFTIENNVPKIYNPEHLKDILDSGNNLNDTNTFGRNILFYPCKEPTIMKDILKNTNIFVYDNMGGNPLSTNTSIANQLYILTEMIKINPQKTQEFINQEDIFGRNFFSRLGTNYEEAMKHDQITLQALTEVNLVVQIFELLSSNNIVPDLTKGTNLLDSAILKTYYGKLAPNTPIDLDKLKEIYKNKKLTSYSPEEIISYQKFVLSSAIEPSNSQTKLKTKI